MLTCQVHSRVESHFYRIRYQAQLVKFAKQHNVRICSPDPSINTVWKCDWGMWAGNLAVKTKNTGKTVYLTHYMSQLSKSS